MKRARFVCKFSIISSNSADAFLRSHFGLSDSSREQLNGALSLLRGQLRLVGRPSLRLRTAHCSLREERDERR